MPNNKLLRLSLQHPQRTHLDDAVVELDPASRPVFVLDAVRGCKGRRVVQGRAPSGLHGRQYACTEQQQMVLLRRQVHHPCALNFGPPPSPGLGFPLAYQACAFLASSALTPSLLRVSISVICPHPHPFRTADLKLTVAAPCSLPWTRIPTSSSFNSPHSIVCDEACVILTPVPLQVE